MSQILTDFIREALRAGKNRADIDAVLQQAGWPTDQLQDAWKKYCDVPFPVPVPRPTLYASPRLTALNLFHFVVLYTAIFSTVSVLFTFLDYHLPNGLGRMAGAYYSTKPIGEEIRGYLSALLVSAPLVVVSYRLLYKAMSKIGQYIPGIRLKLLNLTLLIASMVMLCNFIGLVYYFLSGELSLRFVIKVVILSSVCFGLYHYFKPEMQLNESRV